MMFTVSNFYNYYFWCKDSIYFNYWIVRNDSLVFETKENPFGSHFIQKDFLHSPDLSLKEFDEKEVQIIGWKTSHRFIESNINLYTKNYTLLENYYERLNILINNRLMAGDGRGFTTIYSKEYGIIRTSVYNSFWSGSNGIGWDKID